MAKENTTDLHAQTPAEELQELAGYTALPHLLLLALGGETAPPTGSGVRTDFGVKTDPGIFARESDTTDTPWCKRQQSVSPLLVVPREEALRCAIREGL